jgi:hypothetical protein
MYSALSICAVVKARCKVSNDEERTPHHAGTTSRVALGKEAWFLPVADKLSGPPRLNFVSSLNMTSKHAHTHSFHKPAYTLHEYAFTVEFTSFHL